KRVRRVIRLSTWLSQADLSNAFATFGAVDRGLFVHSSLSACGQIHGGPETVIHALEHWTDGALLAAPTHTYCYPSPGEIPPVFDPARTRSAVGSISDAFWRR